ncbi:hypothetical protein [Burkholderia sp. Bp9004]|uniref:hypothetical protein n=1 Tax=Burkholderia sp. Bp9004 TaxID=2184559 RepID=UPI000F603EDD|nr:hypothetical protein [Burkholderia sp. Bp9004]RQZ62842.1 hypothetical protein DIE08_26975 [Burkholderia sp. Bp9004]
MATPPINAESILALFQLVAGHEECRTSGEPGTMTALLALAEQLATNHQTMSEASWDAAVRVGGLLLRAEMMNNDADMVALELLNRLRRRK